MNESLSLMIQSVIHKKKLFHYCMNQHFWANLLNLWFNASPRKKKLSILDESAFLNESLKRMINPPLTKDLFHYWMNQYFWMNHLKLIIQYLTKTCFINGWISIFTLISWTGDLITHKGLVSLLHESAFLNESLKWII